MSKNYNRAKYNKGFDRRGYKILLNDDLFPPYWDEGIYFHPKYRRGYKNPNKTIYSYQKRMYKTWKHNRKTQWKN